MKNRRKRYIEKHVQEDLREKMVLIAGPRQVGKTTFGLGLLSGTPKNESHPGYLNWDALKDREKIIQGQLPPGQRRVLLDEIHKYAQWRNTLKGLYDKNKSSVSFLVTGSARLDYYRKGGDSLQGRYHFYRLHPFTVTELAGPQVDKATLEKLIKFGGFPEPLFKGQERFHRRWMREVSNHIVHEDLRDLENVREHSMIELLLHHLPSCVGSPLSVNSLSILLQVAHETVDRWLSILERLYVCFRIPPFGAKRIRAVKKEKKLYFWDWSRVDDRGARFENMVACQLLKYCHFIEDTQGYDMELRYIRDTDKREVDFVVLRDRQPEFALECKCGEKRIAPACSYFRDRTPISSFYQVHLGEKDFGDARTNVRVLPFVTFCRELAMP
jgi:predicted AAA+ superfamily ATPase